MTGKNADAAAEWVRESAAITSLSGAGISTDSGIPDFRGPRGVWTQNPAAQQMFTLQSYVSDREVRVRSWRTRRQHAAWTAEPNAGHHALVELERQGRLTAIVTQNIDELHQRAGSSPARVIELHGTVWEVECLGCRDRTRMADALARVDAGEQDPPCLRCGGILKSATISFGQQLDRQVLAAAVNAARSAELLLTVGTSLQVQPAAWLCNVAKDSGARLIVVNAQPTPYDGLADAVVRDPISEVLPALVRS